MISTKQIGTVVMIVMAILAALSQGAVKLPTGIPDSWGPIIQSWSGFIMAIYLLINPFLPASTFGPLKPDIDAKVLTKDTKVELPKGTPIEKP
jgi:hypothetical protein